MKTNLFITMAVATLVLAGCSNNEGIPDNGVTELRLSGNIEVQTRSFGPTQSTTILSDRKVYVWADEIITSGTQPFFNAWELTADGANGFNVASGDNKYFPQSGNCLNLYAVHGNFTPDITIGTTAFPVSALTHSVKDNQVAVADYCASDLLYATKDNVARTKETIGLKFYHLLSKVEITLKAGAGLADSDLENATVRILNTKLSAGFTPGKQTADEMETQATRAGMVVVTGDNTGVITLPAKFIEKTATDFSGADYAEAIIVPQTVTGQFIEVDLGEGLQPLYYNITNKVFESGKRYRYNITVNLAGLSVASTILDWEDGGGDPDGEATMPL